MEFAHGKSRSPNEQLHAWRLNLPFDHITLDMLPRSILRGFFSAVCGAFLSAACARDVANEVPYDCNDSGVWDQGGTVYFCDNITDATVAEVFNLGLEDKSRIIISSRGGDTLAAINLAERIRDSKLDLIVGRECFSACASFVLLANEKFWVSSYTVIGLHHTRTVIRREIYNYAGLESKYFSYGSTKEIEFYEKRSVNLELLFRPYDLLPKRSISFDISKTDLTDPAFASVVYDGPIYIKLSPDQFEELFRIEINNIDSYEIDFDIGGNLNPVENSDLQFLDYNERLRPSPPKEICFGTHRLTDPYGFNLLFRADRCMNTD